MDAFPPLSPRFQADAYRGTAEYYVRHRPPYPALLVRDLLGRVPVSGQGRLLDLACGPGRLALALAPSFHEVLAVDAEEEMLAVGQLQAARRGVGNVRWELARAEDLKASAASFELVTIGEAFHRLDQPRVAPLVFGWLQPGGGVATLGNYGILAGREPWQRIVLGAVRKWAPAPPAEPPSHRPPIGPENDAAVLRAAGFQDVASHPFLEERVWTIPEIFGYLYSTSICSRRVLGAAPAAFEAELTAALLAHDPAGRYRESLQWGYTFGRKPSIGGPA